MLPSTPLTLKEVAPVFHALTDEPRITAPSCVLPGVTAACAATGSSPHSRHRHSIVPNSIFQIFIVSPLLSKAHAAFGNPKAVVRARTTMLFARRRT